MGFQPFDTAQKLLYPSQQTALGGGLYDTNGLTETAAGSGLYSYQIGDYAYPSFAPIPHVEATLFTFATGTQTITLYRTVGSRTMKVPGQVNVYAVGGRNIADWEAPFGVPITYRAEQFDADGNSLGFTTPTKTQLDEPGTWVQNPFDPLSAVQVTVLTGAAVTVPRPTPTNLYYPSGSGLAVAISTQRQGVTAVAFPFFTETEDDADTVRDMFGDPYTTPSGPPVLVIRTGAGLNLRLPQPFHASIAEPVETPIDTMFGGSFTRWDCTATEIARPAPALIGTVLTYADIDSAYDTWADADAAYTSYLQRDRDYTLAGNAELITDDGSDLTTEDSEDITG